MASKLFAAALAAFKQNKNVESILVGTSYLSEGTHDVTIKAIDVKDIDTGKVRVVYVNSEGKEFSDNMFLTDREGGFSYGLRAFLSAISGGDTEVLSKFIELVTSDDHALEIFTGMAMRIILEPGKGIQARATGSGGFAGFDLESGEKATPEFEEVKEVYNYCKANDLKRSYLRLKGSKATSAEKNVAAFWTAVKAKESSKSVMGASFSTSRVV